MAKKSKGSRRSPQQTHRRRVQRAGQQAPSGGPPPRIPADAAPAVEALAPEVDADAVEAVESDGADIEGEVTRPAAAAPSGVAQRRVGRIDPTARRAKAGRAVAAAAAFEPLEPDDAAIPFDRVPYVPSDLRRVGVMAVLMVVLIVIADIVVTRVVG